MKKNIKSFFSFLFIAIFAALIGLFIVLPLPGNIPVLMYHFVGSKQDAKESKNFVSRESFAAQMSFLKQFGYRVISMEEYDQILKGRRKPVGKEIVITFDDGNYTFETLAFPILKLYNFSSTLFLVSENVKQQLHGSMGVDSIQKLAKTGLVTLAAHSKTHPYLSKMRDDQIEEEILGSKKDLEEIFGISMNYFSYPFGDMDDRVVRYTQNAGYSLAFTTSPSHFAQVTKRNYYTIPRVKISRTSDNFFLFWIKVSGIYEYFKIKKMSDEEMPA